MPVNNRVPRETLLPVLRDVTLSSGEIAARFGYTRHWITHLRGRLGIKGAPGWGGDHKSAAFRASQAQRAQRTQRMAAE